jgi:hypothetical protein
MQIENKPNLTTVQEAGVDPGFVKLEAYPIFGALFKKE